MLTANQNISTEWTKMHTLYAEWYEWTLEQQTLKSSKIGWKKLCFRIPSCVDLKCAECIDVISVKFE